jgi:uncharacterized protein YaaQ
VRQACTVRQETLTKLRKAGVHLQAGNTYRKNRKAGVHRQAGNTHRENSVRQACTVRQETLTKLRKAGVHLQAGNTYGRKRSQGKKSIKRRNTVQQPSLPKLPNPNLLSIVDGIDRRWVDGVDG